MYGLTINFLNAKWKWPVNTDLLKINNEGKEMDLDFFFFNVMRKIIDDRLIVSKT